MRMYFYCCCGVKKRDNWVCDCDWDGWYLCFECKNIPVPVPIKKIPDKDGKYYVRTSECGDFFEEESEFSIKEKNWGRETNKVNSHWEVECDDNWLGYRGVYAWKKKR